MSKKSDDQAVMVIVGGGGAESNLCRALSSKLDPTKYKLVLVTQRDFHLHLRALPRMVVTSVNKLEDVALMPYDKLFVGNNGTLKKELWKAIMKRVAKSSFMRGRNWNTAFSSSALAGPIQLPLGKDEALRAIDEWRVRFKEAKSVILVGGWGRWHRSQSAPSWRANYFKRPSCDIAAGITVTTTLRGVNLNADFILPARGGRPNTGSITSLGEAVLDDNGRVRVNECFQVLSHPNIFAAGDVTNIAEEKQLTKYGKHSNTIIPNFISILDGKASKVHYKGATEAIFKRGVGFIKILYGVSLGD
ncbi:hypothetical protein C8R44DRAFT_869970 [Mycena epipterygia]|nr:hypothetical protein C8R44DRAFT_869970 [Mycena epipterygia]